MFLRLFALASLAASVALADPASHRQAAAEMLDLISGQETLNASIGGVLAPMLENMKQRGTPEAALSDIKQAYTDWMKEEIRWDELRPKMVELYVNQFTEAELKELTAFYRSPVGRKALKALPNLMMEGAKIGQAYAKTKEASLQQRLQKVAEKHNLGK